MVAAKRAALRWSNLPAASASTVPRQETYTVPAQRPQMEAACQGIQNRFCGAIPLEKKYREWMPDPQERTTLLFAASAAAR